MISPPWPSGRRSVSVSPPFCRLPLNWSTGTGDSYFANITDFGKKFENSHWMAPRKDGITEATWEASKYGQALKFMEKCNDNAADPTCIWADVPRGNFNNPKVSP